MTADGKQIYIAEVDLPRDRDLKIYVSGNGGIRDEMTGCVQGTDPADTTTVPMHMTQRAPMRSISRPSGSPR